MCESTDNQQQWLKTDGVRCGVAIPNAVRCCGDTCMALDVLNYHFNALDRIGSQVSYPVA